MAEWDHEVVGHLREDIKEVRDMVGRLEGRLQGFADHSVSAQEWQTWKDEVWEPTQTGMAHTLKAIQHRTSLWLGMLAGAILTGLVGLTVRLLVQASGKG